MVPQSWQLEFSVLLWYCKAFGLKKSQVNSSGFDLLSTLNRRYIFVQQVITIISSTNTATSHCKPINKTNIMKEADLQNETGQFVFLLKINCRRMRIYLLNIKKTSQKEISWIDFFYCIFLVLILKLNLQCFIQVTALLNSWARKKNVLAPLFMKLQNMLYETKYIPFHAGRVKASKMSRSMVQIQSYHKKV